MFQTIFQVKSMVFKRIVDLKKEIMQTYGRTDDQVTLDFVQIESELEMINVHLMFKELGIGHHYTISFNSFRVMGRCRPETVAEWFREWKLTEDIRIKH